LVCSLPSPPPLSSSSQVDHADPSHTALHAFNALWDAHFAADCLLVYSTGRSHALYEQLRREVPALRPPCALVCSVGTEIFFEASDAEPVPDAAWCAALDVGGWDRGKVEAAAAGAAPELTLQPPSEQRPHKVSFHCALPRDAASGVLARLTTALEGAGLATTVIYSGGADVDVLPAGASKGKGLSFLLSQIADAVGPPTDGVLVCGDSGNDVELFEVDGVRGVVVANAHEELRAWAQGHAGERVFEAGERCSAGIAQALRHFGLV
jgi:sucrose-6F-phosphate phosphohydrolase